MSNIFLTSDPHFFHEHTNKDGETRGIRFMGAGRPYSSMEEMHEALIENHNKVVRPGDIVYTLGDFAWRYENHGGLEAVKNIFNRLNGDIHLILGNHDDPADMQKLGFSSISPYRELKFKPPGQSRKKIVLFHYPIAEHNRFYDNMNGDIESYHFYGHVHSHPSKPHVSGNPFSYDVGVDRNNMTPVALEDAMEIVNRQVRGT